MKKILLSAFLIMVTLLASAQVRLPRMISDSMILQRDEKVRIWGWASPKEKIAVRFNQRNYKTVADAEGQWSLILRATAAGGPYTMEITASNKITIREILLGDVWFCSGQSNMVHQLNIHDVTYASEIAQANYPQIRQFLVPTATNLNGPQTDVSGGPWKAALGDNVRPFSAVAYFFAKQLAERYKIPIGIINASVGGTAIESWMSEEGLKQFPDLSSTVIKNKDTAYIRSLISQSPVTTPPPPDAGSSEKPNWSDPAYTIKGWRPINIPGFWEDQGLKDLNGVVWFRRDVMIPQSMAGKPARVFLGRIVDADELFINGVSVGSTSYQYPQRRYTVRAGLLKAGLNTFAVRVTNSNGKGGFVPDKPYCLFAGTDTIDLKGTWHYKVGLAYRALTPGQGRPVFSAQSQPAVLYNAMVAPEINYNIKGICWYQGETNTGQPDLYARLLPAMISDWRMKWKMPSLPFLYVQLPGFMDYNYQPSESNWAILRESQLKALAVPNTGMAVAIDLGEWNDIHPDNKKSVGERLARAALKVAYHEQLVHSGPVFDTATISGNEIIIRFSETGTGLTTTDGDPPGSFAIAGTDNRFVWAKTRIDGDKVIVWSDEVTAPKTVRYAWADNPVNANLINREGLPASPFRTQP